MTVANAITQIKQAIAEAEHTSHRPPGSVSLLAVSKGQPLSAVTRAFEAGLRDFGENYLQEAEAKINALADYPIRWHFIGSIQSNKCKAIAHYFDWLHSLYRSAHAQTLNDARPKDFPKLNVCIQINLNDPNKGGVSPHDAEALAKTIVHLPNLHLRGLMLLPNPTQTTSALYSDFQCITDLMHHLNRTLHTDMDTLSMGMSHDFKTAIQAGSTLVRIGRSIFGKRA